MGMYWEFSRIMEEGSGTFSPAAAKHESYEESQVYKPKTKLEPLSTLRFCAPCLVMILGASSRPQHKIGIIATVLKPSYTHRCDFIPVYKSRAEPGQ